MRKKFLVIHNKMAGRLKLPLSNSVMSRLEKCGARLELKAANSVEEDIELAGQAVRAGEVDAVIAAGGDSTIRGVAMALVGTELPLGVLPAGTGNVLAQEINLTRKPDQIATTLMEGDLKSVTPGLANGEPFLLKAGVGFDAGIVKNLDHHLKQRIRKAAYAGPTLKALVARPPELSVTFPEDGDNGGNYRAAFVVVTKVRHYGGAFVIAPDADLAADELQVVMFMDCSRLGMVRALIGLAMGKNARLKKSAIRKTGELVGHIMKTHGVMIRACKKVRITSLEPVPTQIDGEWLGYSPLDIRTGEQALKLIVPKS